MSRNKIYTLKSFKLELAKIYSKGTGIEFQTNLLFDKYQKEITKHSQYTEEDLREAISLFKDTPKIRTVLLLVDVSDADSTYTLLCDMGYEEEAQVIQAIFFED